MNKKTCDWPKDDPLMIEYHDTEWGVPLHDDQKLFEFLTLESFQAGLSWQTILRKRENFRKGFDNFDYVKIAAYGEEKIIALLQDSGIVRNKAKIHATINNANMFMKIQQAFGTFDSYMWQFVGGKPKINSVNTLKQIPVTTKESDDFSRDLKQRGFKFVGSTTMYAHMQATGMVNDHLTECFRYQEVMQTNR